MCEALYAGAVIARLGLKCMAARGGCDATHTLCAVRVPGALPLQHQPASRRFLSGVSAWRALRMAGCDLQLLLDQ